MNVFKFIVALACGAHAGPSAHDYISGFPIHSAFEASNDCSSARSVATTNDYSFYRQVLVDNQISPKYEWLTYPMGEENEQWQAGSNTMDFNGTKDAKSSVYLQYDGATSQIYGMIFESEDSVEITQPSFFVENADGPGFCTLFYGSHQFSNVVEFSCFIENNSCVEVTFNYMAQGKRDPQPRFQGAKFFAKINVD